MASLLRAKIYKTMGALITSAANATPQVPVDVAIAKQAFGAPESFATPIEGYISAVYGDDDATAQNTVDTHVTATVVIMKKLGLP